MYIQSRPTVALYRLAVSVVATVSLILQFVVVGTAAWRTFPVWFLLIVAVYYAVLSIITAFMKRRDSGKVICPTLQGALLLAGTIIATATAIFGVVGMPGAGPTGFILFLANFCVPLMILLDWILFTRKGAWRFIDPFYWLALPIIYVSYILTSAAFMPASAELIYPYGFLDFPVINLDTMLWWMAILLVLALTFGYIYVVLDFAMSGRLGKYVVLPKIKTIVIEEEVVDQPSVEKAPVVSAKEESQPSSKTAKTVQPVKTVKSQKKPTPKPVRSDKTQSKAGKSQPKSDKPQGNKKSGASNRKKLAPKQSALKQSASKPEHKVEIKSSTETEA